MKKLLTVFLFLLVTSIAYGSTMTCDTPGGFKNIYKCSVSRDQIIYYIDTVTKICFAGIEGNKQSFVKVDCSDLTKRNEIAKLFK